ERLARPDSTSTLRFTGASGDSVGVSTQSDPAWAGRQVVMFMPQGANQPRKRFGDVGGARAVRGASDSNSGKASVTPAARRQARRLGGRGIGFGWSPGCCRSVNALWQNARVAAQRRLLFNRGMGPRRSAVCSVGGRLAPLALVVMTAAGCPEPQVRKTGDPE